jgi:hypothetical protein
MKVSSRKWKTYCCTTNEPVIYKKQPCSYDSTYLDVTYRKQIFRSIRQIPPGRLLNTLKISSPLGWTSCGLSHPALDATWVMQMSSNQPRSRFLWCKLRQVQVLWTETEVWSQRFFYALTAVALLFHIKKQEILFRRARNKSAESMRIHWQSLTKQHSEFKSNTTKPRINKIRIGVPKKEEEKHHQVGLWFHILHSAVQYFLPGLRNSSILTISQPNSTFSIALSWSTQIPGVHKFMNSMRKTESSLFYGRLSHRSYQQEFAVYLSLRASRSDSRRQRMSSSRTAGH